MCKRPHLISIIIYHQEITPELAGDLKKCLMIYMRVGIETIPRFLACYCVGWINEECNIRASNILLEGLHSITVNKCNCSCSDVIFCIRFASVRGYQRDRIPLPASPFLI